METLKTYWWLINLAALLLCAADKLRAKKGRWRIPEDTLLLSALLGGSAGLLAGMLLFRHKTKHKKFTLLVPLLLALQLGGEVLLQRPETLLNFLK